MLWTVAVTSVLLLTSGGALIGALLLTRRWQLQMERRVELVTAPEPQPIGAPGAELQSVSSRLSLQLRRVFAVGAGRYWGMSTGAFGLVTMCIAAGAATWILTHAVVGLPLWLAAPITAFLAYFVPRLVLLRQQGKAEREFTDLFPDAVDAMARMLRAGLPITTAVRSVSVESPPPVNSVFALIANQVEIGAPIEVALDTSSRSIGLPDFRFFTVAVVMQHATGGNLAATLEILSDIVRKRRAVRLKAKATTAEIRVSGYVLGSLPLLIVGALLLIQPGYLSPLFIDPRGQVILAMAAGGMLLAGLTMRQMMRSVTNI